MKTSYLYLLPILFCFNTFLSGQTYQLSSFDKNTVLTVNTRDSITWSVTYKNKNTIEKTCIALTINDQIILGNHSKVMKDSLSLHKGEITSIVPNKDLKIKDEYRQLTLKFENKFGIEFRVYNDGVAYRFITGFNDTIHVTSEKMDLNFPGKTTCYFPQEKSMYSHYERAYLLKSLDTIGNKTFCSLPVLFTTPDSVRVLFTEANLYDYPGMFLRGNESNGLKAAFPKYVLETKPAAKGPDRNEIVSIEIENTDWISPGKVAWDWYNANNLSGMDFTSGLNTETYKYYIDFASRYGLEYVILDEGWSKLRKKVAG